ncbi:hypothetical protein WN944_013471 [Citrus x changshan-huyou]|uniref:Uncharacterized protein n=1 Tax=Citrus x changshan-huyou TaxID=2935761 RepID=A0AAP0M590_9ROSI
MYTWGTDVTPYISVKESQAKFYPLYCRYSFMSGSNRILLAERREKKVFTVHLHLPEWFENVKDMDAPVHDLAASFHFSAQGY